MPEKNQVLLISWAARRPWSSPCTSLRGSPDKSQTFVWWELSFHIQQTFPECLLCAQHWAELWSSSRSCTPPVSLADLQPVRSLCSQKLVQRPGKGDNPAGQELLANGSIAFSGPKSQSRGGARWSEGIPLPSSVRRRPTPRWG